MAEVRPLSMTRALDVADDLLEEADTPGGFLVQRVNVVIFGRRADGTELEVERIWVNPDHPPSF